LCGLFIFRDKEKGFIFWLFLFSYLFLDDFLAIHEGMGESLMVYFENLSLMGMRPQDIGEALVLGLIGLFFASLLAIVYYYGSDTFRSITRNLLIMLLALVLFGFVFDMLGMMVHEYKILHNLFTIIEDGGEMVIISLICWYFFSLRNTATLSKDEVNRVSEKPTGR
jgi:hypothetical protein